MYLMIYMISYYLNFLKTKFKQKRDSCWKPLRHKGEITLPSQHKYLNQIQQRPPGFHVLWRIGELLRMFDDYKQD
jgi:hypothetical protein